jgi:hypothetical protein
MGGGVRADFWPGRPFLEHLLEKKFTRKCVVMGYFFEISTDFILL